MSPGTARVTGSGDATPEIGGNADIRVHARSGPSCEQNCATQVTVDHRSGRVLSIRSDRENPRSQRFVCPKAAAVKDLHHDPAVLTGPMIRRNGQLEPASWDEALDYAARRLGEVQATDGQDAVVLFFGTSIAHIPGFAFDTAPLLNALQTRQIYSSSSSIDCQPHFLAAMTMFGGFISFPVPDIDRTDYFVLIGANRRRGSDPRAGDDGGQSGDCQPERRRTPVARDRRAGFHAFVRYLHQRHDLPT